MTPLISRGNEVISADDAAFLASYEVDAADPAAPELLRVISNQVAAFEVAWFEIGPDQFLHHLSIQIARLHADLDKARADLRLLLEFQAPAGCQAIN